MDLLLYITFYLLQRCMIFTFSLFITLMNCPFVMFAYPTATIQYLTSCASTDALLKLCDI